MRTFPDFDTIDISLDDLDRVHGGIDAGQWSAIKSQAAQYCPATVQKYSGMNPAKDLEGGRAAHGQLVRRRDAGLGAGHRARPHQRAPQRRVPEEKVAPLYPPRANGPTGVDGWLLVLWSTGGGRFVVSRVCR